MSTTWILVAESSKAKLYSADNLKEPLKEIRSFDHPEGKMHEGDLVADGPGSDSGSGPGRHKLEEKTSAHDHEKEIFAKELAIALEQGFNNNDFDRLVLVAPPSFLGVLRDKASKNVMAKVTEQLDKNLVNQPPEDIRNSLSVLV